MSKRLQHKPSKQATANAQDSYTLDLGQLLSAVEKDVLNPTHAAKYEKARHQHPALADYPTVADVLNTLADERPRTIKTRDAITLALVREYQASGDSLWSSILLVAYQPMLKNLRRKVRGTALLNDDINHLIISSFLTTAAAMPVNETLDRMPVRLKSLTSRAVLKAIKDEQDEQAKHQEPVCTEDGDVLDPVDAIDCGYECWPETPPANLGPSCPDEAADAVCMLVENASDLIDGGTFDLLTVSLIKKRRISVSLCELFPAVQGLSPEERRQFYQRIKRRHSRALAVIRPAFEQYRCPRCGGAGICRCEKMEDEIA